MKAKKKSKAKKWIIAGVITVALISAASTYLFNKKQPAYDIVTAETGDITTYYSFSGNVEAKSRQAVSAEKLMQISEIKVKAGDIVKAGDVLLKNTVGEEIKAKIAGEVSNINISESAMVMAGVKLLDIVDYSSLIAKIKIDEYDLSSVSKGQEAAVHINSLDKDITGTIDDISREGTTANGVTYFTANVSLKSNDSLRVGMSTEVKLKSGHASGVVTLPMSALQFDESNNPYVFKGDGKSPVKSEITVGINDGAKVEIKTGISAGETVLVPIKTNMQTGFDRRRSSTMDGGTNQ